ncbi:pilus assembly protein CpaE [Palleronia marisminoris]|uniref:Septum site-determining protein MinD n=1 Tax=Palleronia marisminoris TaxID=315423 RepID=A0A1Y5T2W3_9RHOB|nr:AAA family ATPase [Palleronia marisminoris]SFH15088.1 pilus assembly protein CpaE [Palleronia marisminoris]SLN54692.1 Septum site-determining protein MinD [Palleronia marisminoris]
MTNVALAEDLAPIRACTVCRDIRNFDLLIEDMETTFGESWGDLSYADATIFLAQPDARSLEVLVLAIDPDDEPEVDAIGTTIRTAIAHDVKVILIAEEVSPLVLHQLLKLGATEFVPYPLPDGALADAIARTRSAPALEPITAASEIVRAKPGKGDRNGVVLPVHGLAGGVGASTFAVNLANELSLLSGKQKLRVCILDFDLQFGAVASYLDLPQREAVVELLSDTEAMDADQLFQAMVSHDDRLHVLTSPAELVPLDLILPEDVERILDLACAQFDYVIVDMPSTVVQWTETVLARAHVYFALLERDMRSAQNTLRLIRALKAEELPSEKLRFVMNRAPKFTDLAGRTRMKKLAESLGVSIDVQLPDGGKAVTETNDSGLPLAAAARKNPLRKEIAKIAASAHELNRNVAES